jgi:hypothetical protein
MLNLFRILSVCPKFHSVYNRCMQNFIPRIQRPRQKYFNIQNVFFHCSLKKKCQYFKKQSEAELLELTVNSKIILYHSCMTKHFFPRLCIIGGMTFQIWISRQIRIYIQKYFRVWIRDPYGAISWKNRSKKSHAKVPLTIVVPTELLESIGIDQLSKIHDLVPISPQPLIYTGWSGIQVTIE